jgi:hypothetical protein
MNEVVVQLRQGVLDVFPRFRVIARGLTNALNVVGVRDSAWRLDYLVEALRGQIAALPRRSQIVAERSENFFRVHFRHRIPKPRGNVVGAIYFLLSLNALCKRGARF